MDYHNQNTDYPLHIDFIDLAGDPVSPNIVLVSMFGNDGETPISDYDDKPITIPTGSYSLDLVIPAVHLQKTLDTEFRSIKVVYQFGAQGILNTITKGFLLRDGIRFLPISPRDVLSSIGLQPDPDLLGMVDIYGALDIVQEDAGDSVDISALIISGSSQAKNMLYAIKYRAAMMFCLGIENALMQSEQGDNTIYKRFSTVNFEALRQGASEAYSRYLYLIQGTVAEGSTPTYSLMVQGTDPVTGE